MERLSMEVYPSFFRGSTFLGGGAHLLSFSCSLGEEDLSYQDEI
jgi:hypothetical protein